MSSPRPTSAPPTGPPPLRPARGLAWATALGTVPYLALKTAWLAGYPLGVGDPAFLAQPAVVVLNVVTLGMDALVIVLAVALVAAWGRRLPPWLLLLPAWVGVGFLAPIVVVILPTALLAPADPGGSLAPWVQPLVYGGFAWQGVFLCLGVAAHARRRWFADPTGSSPEGSTTSPVAVLARVTATGGAVVAAGSATLRLTHGALSGSAATLVVETGQAALAAAGIVGVLALVRGTIRRRPATVAAFLGSGALFSWGLWGATTSMAAGLGLPGPLVGSAQLTGLLAGFALAVAGLLAITARPGPAG